MKTTLEIPDEIYRAVKIRAAREGKTVTKLVAGALAAALNGPDPVARGPRRLKRGDERRIGEWMQKEGAFLESMRGPVFGEGAVSDLFGSRG